MLSRKECLGFSTTILILLCSTRASASLGLDLVVAKELEQAQIWCSSHDDSRASTCDWILPNQESCQFGQASSSKCLVDDSVTLQQENGNCTVTIAKLIQGKHNGDWTCTWKEDNEEVSEFQTTVVVAREAKVEFENNLFGTVSLTANEQTPIGCAAKHGRPVGEFTWRIGEQDDPDAKVFKSNREPMKMEDGQGYLNVREEFTYLPKIADEGKNLYCIYEQMDERGNLLYRDEDHISLSIFYLTDPPDEMPVFEGQIGDSMNITMQFEAHPKPRNTDVTWVVSKANRIRELTLDDSPFTRRRLTAYPIKTIGESKYEVTLQVSELESDDVGHQYLLRVENRKEKTDEVFRQKEYPFDLKVIGTISPDGETKSDTSDPVEKMGMSVGAIVGIVIGILALLVIVAVVMFLSWSRKLLCFAPRTPRRTRRRGPQQGDPRMIHEREEVHLDEPLYEDPNERPIIKVKPRPMETKI